MIQLHLMLKNNAGSNRVSKAPSRRTHFVINPKKEENTLKTFGLLAVVVSLAGLFGCATTRDLNRTQADLDQKIKIINEKVMSADENNQVVKKDVDSYRASVMGLQKSQANAGADLTELREQVQQLRGQVESLQKGTSDHKKADVTELREQLQQLRSQVESLQKETGDHKNFKEKLDQLVLKINFLDTYLGIEDKEANVSKGNGTKSEEQAKAKAGDAGQYATASAFFKEGKYEKARTEFQNYLKANPKASDSDNAQFWIGETYYFEKKYEKAILEYEKVIKNYPDGNKVSNALFKQGLSFLMLGDKASARLIFQQVIKDYPNTSQARTARAKLSEIK